MALTSVLAIAGCIALLIGLLGGGVRVKELDVPRISTWTRIVSIILGLGLVGTAIWISTAELREGSEPVLAPTQAGPQAPVLKSVTIREEETQDGLVIRQEVSYSDPQGDAQTIDWILVDSSKEGEAVFDGQVDDPVDAQIQGSTFTGVWTCTGGEYTVTIQAVLIDRAGNRSQPLEYSLDCR